MSESPRPRVHKAARVIVPVAAVAAAFGGFAIAYAATDSGVDTPHDLAERGLDTGNPPATGAPSAAASPVATETNDSVTLPDGATQTFPAGAAGTVTIGRTGSVLNVVAVGTNAGWTAEIERASGAEVEVEFRNGTARIDLEAELEDGAVQVRVRERNDAVDDDDDDGTPPTSPTTPTTPPTRVDNSGPGSVDGGHDGDDDGVNHNAGDDSGSHSGSGNSGSGNSGSGSSGSGDSGSGHSGSDD
jgi:hypothetical protein